MGAIPTQQKLHSMYGGDGDVHGVLIAQSEAARSVPITRLPMHRSGSCVSAFEFARGNATAVVLPHDRRLQLHRGPHVRCKSKLRMPRVPPSRRDSLHPRCSQIPARPRGQEARDGGFQVQPRPVENIFRRCLGNTERFPSTAWIALTASASIPASVAYQHPRQHRHKSVVLHDLLCSKLCRSVR